MSQKSYPPASRAGLILTPTTDKNGRPTHVWRRANDIDSLQLNRIPFRPSTVASNQFYSVGFDPDSIKTSPWGKVENVSEQVSGIYAITAENGRGIYLSPARQDEIDERWSLGEDGFYSSDGLDWSVIPFTFPEEFGEKAFEESAANLRNHRPHEYMDITSEFILEEDSIALSAESFDAAHNGEFAATSMTDGVSADEVIVTAARIGDSDEEAQFVIPKKELEDDGELPKGHRKLIDEERHVRTTTEIEDLKRELLDALKVAIVAKFPRSRYLISTYAVTRAAIQGANKFRKPEDEDKYVGKDWGLSGMMTGFLIQLITEVNNSKEYPVDVDAEYARAVRAQQRKARVRGWVRKTIG